MIEQPWDKDAKIKFGNDRLLYALAVHKRYGSEGQETAVTRHDGTPHIAEQTSQTA